MRSLHLIVAAFLLSPLGHAQCQVASATGVSSEAKGNGIKIVNNGMDSSILQDGMSSWNNCSGNAIPNMSTTNTNPDAPVVRVNFVNGNAPDNHPGSYDITFKTITISADDSSGDPYSLDGLKTLLRDELGHALGLDDVTGSNCLMGGTLTGVKGVSSTDCSFLQNMWASCP
jgi:hypothetical protein